MLRRSWFTSQHSKITMLLEWGSSTDWFIRLKPCYSRFIAFFIRKRVSCYWCWTFFKRSTIIILIHTMSDNMFVLHECLRFTYSSRVTVLVLHSSKFVHEQYTYYSISEQSAYPFCGSMTVAPAYSSPPSILCTGITRSRRRAYTINTNSHIKSTTDTTYLSQ